MIILYSLNYTMLYVSYISIKLEKMKKNYEKLTWYKTNIPKRLSGKRKDQHNHFGV